MQDETTGKQVTSLNGRKPLAGAQLAQKIKAMPKIELHRHLEGSVRLATLVEIARHYGIEMPEYDVETLRPFVQVMPDEPRNMKHFLGKFQTLRQFYRSEAIISRITREIVIDAAQDNVKYMELRFTPNTLRNIIQCSADTLVSLVCDAASKAAEECGIEVRMIVSLNRHYSVKHGEDVLKAAVDHKDRGIVAVDLAGQEAGYPATPFRDLFREAHEEGLYVTIHAGEWAGADSVWDAIGNLNAQRVGHGIWSIKDAGVLSILVERDIALEVCPSSNVSTGAVPNIAAHPLHSLLRQNVPITLNTDDPLIFDITLSDELVRAIEQHRMTFDEVKQSILRAARASFLPPAERDALVTKFQVWLQDF